MKRVTGAAMYRTQLINRILDIKEHKMSTNQVVDACGISKQGFAQMMIRLDIRPIEVERTRGQYGLYIWDMKQVRKSLKIELSNMAFMPAKEV
jgi:hypothetical protein